jgi:hypothetical protein
MHYYRMQMSMSSISALRGSAALARDESELLSTITYILSLSLSLSLSLMSYFCISFVLDKIEGNNNASSMQRQQHVESAKNCVVTLSLFISLNLI